MIHLDDVNTFSSAAMGIVFAWSDKVLKRGLVIKLGRIMKVPSADYCVKEV